MRRQVYIILVAAAALVIVGLIYRAKTMRIHPAREGAAPHVSLRLAWLPGATFAGDYVALSSGYWKSEGLDVTINPGGFEQDAIKLVAGRADVFGITSGPQLLQARANGVPVVAVGAVIPRSPIGWVAKRSSNIREPKDFVGKKVGAEFGTHTEITLEALCAKLGISLDSFKRIPIKFDPRPFVVGEIDVLPVYVIDQPVDLKRAGLELNIIDPETYGVSLAFGNVYFTTEETLKAAPELVRAFLRGAQKGWLSARADPSTAARIISNYAPDTKPDLLEEKLRVTFDFISLQETEYLGVFPMSIDKWRSTAEILVQYGELRGPLPIENVFTNEFVPAMQH